MKQKKLNKGLCLPKLMFIVFMTLKLAEIGQVASWSWWWVTSPLWISFALKAIIALYDKLMEIIASHIDDSQKLK